jgi:mRNA interferase MazF
MLEKIFAWLDWDKAKINLLYEPPGILFHEGEIWWCSIGMNIGVEIYGKGGGFTRPVLVLKKSSANSFLGLPITSRRKDGSWHFPLHCSGCGGSVVLNQARTFDACRLRRKITDLEDDNLQNIIRAFVNFVPTPYEMTPPDEAGSGGTIPKDVSIIPR